MKDMKTAFGRVITLMLNKTFQIMIRFTDSVPMIRKSMFGNEDFVAMNLTIFNLMEPIRNGFWCLVKFLKNLTKNLTRNALKTARKI